MAKYVVLIAGCPYCKLDEREAMLEAEEIPAGSIEAGQGFHECTSGYGLLGGGPCCEHIAHTILREVDD